MFTNVRRNFTECFYEKFNVHELAVDVTCFITDDRDFECL